VAAVADLFLLLGFLLLVLGVGLLSVPAACIVAGFILMLAGASAYSGGGSRA
jgi:hypothetical protein